MLLHSEAVRELSVAAHSGSGRRLFQCRKTASFRDTKGARLKSGTGLIQSGKETHSENKVETSCKTSTWNQISHYGIDTALRIRKDYCNHTEMTNDNDSELTTAGNKSHSLR